MGIDIQQWRCVIGSYRSRSFYTKSKAHKRFNLENEYFSIGIWIVSLNLKCFPTALLICTLLMMSGDVESNPGPGTDGETPNRKKRTYNEHARDEDPWSCLPKTTKWRLKTRNDDFTNTTNSTQNSPFPESSSKTEDYALQNPPGTDDDSDVDESATTQSHGIDNPDSGSTEELNPTPWWFVNEENEDMWYDASEEIDEDQDTTEEIEDIDNQLIYEGASITTGQSALIILSIAFKYSISGELLSEFLTCISVHCLKKNKIHSSLYKFRKFFNNLKTNLKLHRYCQKCDYLISQNEQICPVCHLPSEENTSYFIEIPLEDQIKELFKRKNFHEAIKTRSSKQKDVTGNINDIYDGLLYKKNLDNGMLQNKNNISVMWYTDGVQLFNSSKSSLWPIYFAINELPYKERVLPENLLFAGLWYGKSKPSMSTFLKPIHVTMSSLKTDGVTVDCGHCDKTFVSRALLLCGTCDLPAKCMMLNMTQFNGKYGCPKCLQPGEVVATGKGHTRVFPVNPADIDGPKRSHGQFLENGEEAFYKQTAIYGVKGPSWLTDISSDAINGTAIDYMHTVLLGITRRLLTLWFDSKYSSQPFSVSKRVKIADERLAAIKPPHFVTRLPRSIHDHSKYWKASECRSWIFYYACPVLLGILQPVYFHHFLLFYEAIYILNLDSISSDDLQHSEELLIRFCCQFSELYGVNHMSANLHQLLHLTDCVKQLGPLWIYSCFAFESMNGKLLKMFHGTQHAVIQISNAVTSMMKLPKLRESMENDLESPAGEFYQKLVNKENKYGKTTETISESVHIIGRKVKQRLLPTYLSAILEYLGKPIGDVFVYYRAAVFGLMYFSSHYKTLKRNSFTVKFKHINGNEQFGQIMFFAKCSPVCSCIDERVCFCNSDHVAVIRLIQTDQQNVLQENETSGSIVKAKLGFIFSGFLTNNYIAISLVDLLDVCIYVDVNKESNRIFVTCRPNNKEGD